MMNNLRSQVLAMLIFCLGATNSVAQIEDLLTDIDGPSGFAIQGNDLYFSQYFGGTVSKIDISQAMPTPEEVIGNLSTPFGLHLYQDSLYVADTYSNEILRIDVTNAEAIPEVVMSGIQFPIDMVVSGDYLYFTDSYDEGAISRINLTDASPVKEKILTGMYSVTGLELNQSVMFIADFEEGVVYKTDLEDTTPTAEVWLSGLDGPNHLFLDGDYLYISQHEGGIISRVDISMEEPVVEDIVTGLFTPTGIAVVDNLLIFGQFELNKISTFELPPVLSSTADISSNTLSIYPNPARDFINVENVENNCLIRIYNTEGVKVKEALSHPNQTMAIENLEPGAYFMVAGNQLPLKFVKL
jgi:hypothetical protein